MAGTRIAVLAKTTYNYGSLPANISSPVIALAKSLDVSAYREATLLVRVHSLTISQVGASLKVALGIISQTSQDPAAIFQANGGTPAAVVTVTNALTAPTLLTIAVPANFAGALWIGTKGQQAAIAGTLIATISVDLSVKV